MTRSLRIHTPHLDEITRQAREAAPEECCGLLAGADSVVRGVYPVANSARAPETQYEMEPIGLLRALKQIDRDGWHPLAVYHSHPSSHPIPSLEDIQRAQQQTPTLTHVIISRRHGNSRLQAWQIADGEVLPVELLFDNEPGQALPTTSRAQRVAIVLAAALAVAMLLAVSVTLLPPAPIITPAP